MKGIVCKTRGCGKKKKGGVYLTSEPSERGILPLWVEINPPVRFVGKQFRGQKLIDLELVLAGAPMEEYLLGASAERLKRDRIKEPEILSFGMPLRDRLRTGICIPNGLSALQQLAPHSMRDIGFALRSLARLELGEAGVEVTTGFRMLQEKKYDAFLAAMWRLWRSCPESKKPLARTWVRLAMIGIDAMEDALEVE